MGIRLLFFLILSAALPDGVHEWGLFEKAVRDQVVQKEASQKQFPPIYQKLLNTCSGYPFQKNAAWVFPLQGQGIKDIGRGGFQPAIRYGSSPIRGYDFYDGNLHGGHPAYDIFIPDKNQDSLNDRDQKPVRVLAPVDLLVLSAENDWQPDSDIRGGNYVWALDPLHDRLFYFAHMQEVPVRAGDFCKAGSTIGIVGRTGKNAYPARSPTHLHLMVLDVRGNRLVPFDYLDSLAKIKPYK